MSNAETARAIWRMLRRKRHVLARVLWPDPTERIVSDIAAVLDGAKSNNGGHHK